MRRRAHALLLAAPPPPPPRRYLKRERIAICAHYSSSSSTPATAATVTAASSRSSEVATASALQQQLSFCCLLCGWDVACTSCPFDWYGFDPRKFSRQQRAGQRGTAQPGVRASVSEIDDALATLGLPVTATTGSASVEQIKAAFRVKALEWHPDCSKHAGAEDTFKGIVRAYELLLGTFSPPPTSSAS